MTRNPLVSKHFSTSVLFFCLVDRFLFLKEKKRNLYFDRSWLADLLARKFTADRDQVVEVVEHDWLDDPCMGDLLQRAVLWLAARTKKKRKNLRWLVPLQPAPVTTKSSGRQTVWSLDVVAMAVVEFFMFSSWLFFLRLLPCGFFLL